MIFHHNDVPFDELNTIEGNAGRRYITPAGVFPSVTTVLGQTSDKQWLEEWRSSMGADAADAEMARAATRGSAVHDMAEKYLKNVTDPLDGHIRSNIVEFMSIRTKLNRINNILMQEAPLWSSVMRIAGRVDCIAEYDGVLSIIDFKTSTTLKQASMIHDYFLQTTAYAIMFQERYDIQVDQYVIIMSSERSPVPQIFKGSIADHVVPLVHRINKFHRQDNTTT